MKKIKLNKKKKIILIVTFNVVGIASILLIIWKLLPSLNNKKNVDEDLLNKTKPKLEKSLIIVEEKRDQILAKNKSIELYGDLFSDDSLIDVDYENGNYIFQIDEKTEIIGLSNLINELNKQRVIQLSLGVELNTLNGILNFNLNDIASSIKDYGDLFADNASIKVDYDGTNYNFQIDDKIEITDLNKLNIELNKQGDTTEESYTIENLVDGNLDLNFDSIKTLERAEAKKVKYDSIETYGDLKLQEIEVNWNGTNYEFQIENKEKINNFNKLNEELRKQNFISEEINIDNLKSKNLNWTLTEIVNSILEHGNFFSNHSIINIDFEDGNYIFQIDEKTEIIGLGNFNLELNKQGDQAGTDYNIQNLTDGIRGLNFVFSKKATDHKIEMDSLEVAIVLPEANVEEIESLIEENDSIIERDSGIQNLNENSDVEENINLNNLEIENKNISINRYGDLFGRDIPIKVDYNNYYKSFKNYTFQIGNKNKIIGLDVFNKELNIQKDNEASTFNYINIDDLSGLNIDKKYTIQKAKAKQIQDLKYLNWKYGRLKSMTIFLDNQKIKFYNRNNGSFLNEDGFDVIFSFQYPEDDLDTWKANSSEYKKYKSIETYGDLFFFDTPIKLDYNGVDHTFQVGEKTRIIGINNFNEELNKQRDLTNTDYTLQDLIDGASGLHFDDTETLERELETLERERDSLKREQDKRNSINRYGDLFGRDIPIEVDYKKIQKNNFLHKNYTFQIGDNTQIIGLNDFNKELNIQKDNEASTYNYKNINDLSALNIDEEYTIQKAKAKQTQDVARLITKYGHLKDATISFQDKRIKFINKRKHFLIDEDAFDLIFSFQYPEDDLDTWKANSSEYKKYKSIETYGNLIKKSISVDTDGTKYTFQIGDNAIINGFDDFNRELNTQGDQANTDYNIQDLINGVSGLYFDYDQTPEIAQNKKISIENYGNLFEKNAIFEVQFWSSRNNNEVTIYSINSLKEANFSTFSGLIDELNKQRNIYEHREPWNYDKTVSFENFNHDNVSKDFNWVHKNSLDIYGFYRTVQIFVNEDDELRFWNTGKKIMDKYTLDSQFNKQWLVGARGDNYTVDIDAFIKSLSGYEKINSIKTYGSLFNPIASIKVGYEFENYNFQINTKKKIKDLAAFNDELNKQGDQTNTDYTIQNLINGTPNLNFDNENSPQKVKEKANSFQTYGDLKRTIVSYENDQLKFRLENERVLNENEFDTQFALQYPVETNTFDKNSELVGYKKAKSIEAYGDLKRTIVSYENDQLKFRLENERVLNENEFDTQFALQYPVETNTFDKNSELVGYKKAKSIEAYGDLKRVTTKLTDNNKLIFFTPKEIILYPNDFKNEFAIQYPDEANTFDKNTLDDYSKNKSIETYGNLFDDEISIKVGYKNEDYAFRIDNYKKITSIESLNDELNIQKDNSATIYNYNGIDDIFEPSTLNFDQESINRAKAKKSSITTYGNLKNTIINVELIGEEIQYYTLLNGTKTIIGNYSELRSEIKKQIEIKNHKNIYFEHKLDFNFSKEASEKLFGSLLSMKKLQISYIKNKINFQLHKDGSDFNYKEIIGLDNFLKILNIQKSEEDTEWTKEKIINDQSVFNYYENDNFEKFLNQRTVGKTSVEEYGNLFVDNASIKVDYEDENYTFQIGNKTKIINIEVFNEQLNKQGSRRFNYIIDDLVNGRSGLNFDFQKSPQNAKNKKDSIETYGDLQNASFEFDSQKELVINNDDSDLAIEKDIFIREIKKQNLNSKKITNKIASISQYGNLLNPEIIIAPIYLPYIDKFVFDIKLSESDEIKTIKDFDTLKKHLLFQGADDQIESYTFSEMAQQTEYFNNSLKQENEDWKIWKSFETYGNLIKNEKKIISSYILDETNEKLEVRVKLPHKEAMSHTKLKEVLEIQSTFNNFYGSVKIGQLYKSIYNGIIYKIEKNKEIDWWLEYDEILTKNPQNEGFVTTVSFNKSKEEFNFKLLNQERLVIGNNGGKSLTKYINELNSLKLLSILDTKRVTYYDFFKKLANLELNFDETESLSSAKAKAKEFSIEKYGNLKSSSSTNPIYVNYVEIKNKNHLTFKMRNKPPISTIEKFNKNLLYQDIPMTEDISLLNLYKPQKSLYFDQASLEVARTAIKNKSIQKFGNFRENPIKIMAADVNANNSDIYEFQVATKTKINSIDELNLELIKQDLKPLDKENPDFLSETDYIFQYTGAILKKIYGNPKEFSYLWLNYEFDKNDFTFSFNTDDESKKNKNIIGLDNLKKFLTSNDFSNDTVFDIVDLEDINGILRWQLVRKINDYVSHLFNSDRHGRYLSKTKRKKEIINIYGDLINQEIKISLEKNADGEYTTFFHVLGGKKLNETEMHEIFSDLDSVLVLLDTDDWNWKIRNRKLKVSKKTFENILINKNKIISIETFGDLKDLNEVEVTFDGLNYTFQINGKEEILGLINLKEQITIQNDDQAIKFNDFSLTKANFLNFQELKKNIKKAKSIYTYGDLTNTDTVFNYHNENENYTFQIEGKEIIIGFDKLNKILKKQNKNVETDEITSHNLSESFTNLIQSNTSLENNNENNSLSIQSNSTLQSNDLNFSYAFFVLNFSVLFIFLFKIIKIFFRSKKDKK